MIDVERWSYSEPKQRPKKNLYVVWILTLVAIFLSFMINNFWGILTSIILIPCAINESTYNGSYQNKGEKR